MGYDLSRVARDGGGIVGLPSWPPELTKLVTRSILASAYVCQRRRRLSDPAICRDCCENGPGEFSMFSDSLASERTDVYGVGFDAGGETDCTGEPRSIVVWPAPGGGQLCRQFLSWYSR